MNTTSRGAQGENSMDGAWKVPAFIGSGFFAIGAAAGFPMGFLAAVLMLAR